MEKEAGTDVGGLLAFRDWQEHGPGKARILHPSQVTTTPSILNWYPE
jgi:hypothetical protein